MKTLFTLFSALMFPALSVAQDCYDLAGRDYGIDPDLLRAISFRESSFRIDALNRVSDEKYAVGLMQIHSQNFNELLKYGIQETMLKHDPCMNIYTGAYYLAKFIHLEKDIWRGVGAYNAGRKKSPEQEIKRQRYANEIYVIYRNIKNSH
ncbi:lytic transglycosylase [Salmonella enterica subsp. enterica serovar Ajiobo]|uniref:transglycosylase SLT domain-containing protein n=1 Tax=Morganella morganii TaxID=582 RepID=UPI0012F31F6D|nr:transglycosylase SLT domain-containing protein [Morganella morganii]EBR0130305.1 lytic transglycosylase [Salmonella enterica subsp. enterica serovar Ajiobo]EBW4865273.1 lytic transglycosylase [Salmonella enterica subsp. enterica serovar Oranienburg]MBT0473653.1 transglycosylase SLT domain-containing protein [Morganella morganii subsp. morganii]UMW89853.1 X polypeptide [Morganella morganii]HCT1399595.1 transglycosylase SLT domain-containing protein [Morganella morganii]